MIRAILFMLALYSWSASALPEHCLHHSIHTVAIPVDHRDLSKGHWTYRYQLIPGSHSDAPVLAHLPGGPGQSGIPKVPPTQKPWAVINIDPRGAGCNEIKSPHFADTFRTEQLAFDVLEVIRQEEISDYAIHGHSFGTVWATKVASLAQTWNFPLPKSVILESVLGRHLDSNEYYREFQVQWESLKSELNPTLLIPLLSARMPFGLSEGEWAKIVMTSLLLGHSPTHGHIMKTEILPHLHTQHSLIQTLVRGYIKTILNEEVSISEELHLEIFCRELTSHYWVTGVVLRKGRLVEVGAPVSLCNKKGSQNLYDSADWQIHSPIFYIQGERDPATPLWQAKHHFHGQKSAKKQFLLVPQGGHKPLSYGLEDCADDLFKEILFENKIDQSLNSCLIGPSLQEEI